MENNAKLLAFLADDIHRLIDTINRDDVLAAQPMTGGGFDTLGDFAAYWGRFIGDIEQCTISSRCGGSK